jgi:hypothetical protein
VTAIAASETLACSADARTLQAAIDTYTLLNGGPPASEAELVPDQLRSESPHYDVVDGEIVPAPGSPCT